MLMVWGVIHHDWIALKDDCDSESKMMQYHHRNYNPQSYKKSSSGEDATVEKKDCKFGRREVEDINNLRDVVKLHGH